MVVVAGRDDWCKKGERRGRRYFEGDSDGGGGGGRGGVEGGWEVCRKGERRE